jgi:glycosyltransferase involved in cell wall biosynthesis
LAWILNPFRTVKIAWSYDRPPKLSVIVVTYNHEPYIAQALESVLAQKTEFLFEVLITEDCSTDNTRDIILAYKKQHPQKIRVILSERNIASNAVLSRAILAARGDYVAILDGDDYWISEDKLQQQVKFLDDHPEASLCFHNAWVVDEQGKQLRTYVPSNMRQFIGVERLITSNCIPTCSAMVRRSAVGLLPQWYDTIEYGDWPLWILAAISGKVGYIDQLLGVYRERMGGAWSGLNRRQQLEGALRCLETLEHNLGAIYAPLIGERRAQIQERLLQELS